MPTDAQIRTALDTLGTHQLAAHECFGGAAAVLRGGEPVCESYFGGDRFSDRALFRLASMTKLFTAAADDRSAEPCAGRGDPPAGISRSGALWHRDGRNAFQAR